MEDHRFRCSSGLRDWIVLGLQAEDGVYSMVNEAQSLHLLHPKDRESSSLLQLSHLEPPVDKALTGVKSLSLDTQGPPVPCKNQVKTSSSCPLPHRSPEADLNPNLNPNLHPCPSPKLSGNPGPDQTYSQITLPDAEEGVKKEKRKNKGERGGMSSPCPPSLPPQEPEYSLPFDTIAKNVIADILKSHQALGPEGPGSGADPLYDSIDELQFRSAHQGGAAAPKPTYRKTEHIYDEPEGCPAIGQKPTVPASLYDDPEEMKGNAWRIMGTVVDPKGHEYPYNPRVDDYAVPKLPQRAFPAKQNTNEEEEEEEEEEGEEDSPYDNIMMRVTEREKQ